MWRTTNLVVKIFRSTKKAGKKRKVPLRGVSHLKTARGSTG